MLKQIITISLFTLCLGACQKKDDTKADPGQVTINISSPLPGQIYRGGDTIFVNAAVNYISELHGYELSITDTASGVTMFSSDQHVHNDHFDIAEYFPITGTDAKVLKLELTAEIDHEGHTAQKEMYLQYQP